MCWERSMASQRSFARPSCSRRNKVSQHGWTADNMCLNSYCILICFLKVQHSRWTMQDETTSTSWRCTAIAPTGSLSSRRSCWSRSCSWSLTRSSFPSNNSNFSVFKTSRVFIFIISVLIVSKSLCETCSAAWTTPTSCLFDTLGNIISQAEWTYFIKGII